MTIRNFLGLKNGDTVQHGHAVGHMTAVKLCFGIRRIDQSAQVRRHGSKSEDNFKGDSTLDYVTHVGLVVDSMMGDVHEGKLYRRSDEDVKRCRLGGKR